LSIQDPRTHLNTRFCDAPRPWTNSEARMYPLTPIAIYELGLMLVEMSARSETSGKTRDVGQDQRRRFSSRARRQTDTRLLDKYGKLPVPALYTTPLRHSICLAFGIAPLLVGWSMCLPGLDAASNGLSAISTDDKVLHPCGSCG